jgi:hypothetical protein
VLCSGDWRIAGARQEREGRRQLKLTVGNVGPAGYAAGGTGCIRGEGGRSLVHDRPTSDKPYQLGASEQAFHRMGGDRGITYLSVRLMMKWSSTDESNRTIK